MKIFSHCFYPTLLMVLGVFVAKGAEPFSFSQDLLKPVSADSASAQNLDLKSNPMSNPLEGGETSEVPNITISVAAMEAGIAELLNADWNLVGRCEVRFLSNLKSVEVSSSDYQIEWEGSAPPREQSRIFVRFVISTPEGQRISRRTEVEVSHFVSVYVSRMGLDRNTALGNVDLDIEEVDLLKSRELLVFADVDLDNFELTRNLAPGRSLRWDYIKEIPSIRKGQLIEVEAVDGALRVVLQAQALEDGFHGDFITCRNLQSRQEFEAMVQNQSTARVFF